MNVGIQELAWVPVFNSFLGICLGVELLGHMVNSLFNFWGNYYQLSVGCTILQVFQFFTTFPMVIFQSFYYYYYYCHLAYPYTFSSACKLKIPKACGWQIFLISLQIWVISFIKRVGLGTAQKTRFKESGYWILLDVVYKEACHHIESFLLGQL